jgi:anthranilate phosphoribosyltransferase
MTETNPAQFSAGHLIKEIGRGKKGARSMSREQARDLYAAMLDGRVSDLEMGAIVLAMRIKGESPEELAGFMDAAHACFPQLHAPAGEFAPVLIPSYNGARKMANLTPLLAMLLARMGVPVLIHGVGTDPGRVTTAEILHAMALPAAKDHTDVQAAMALGYPSFMPIEVLAPKLARLLSLRRILGVRNSTHTVVKLLQPFDRPALRLVSYTHPEYLESLGAYFTGYAPHEGGDVFLMRGTEGETVANANRSNEIARFSQGERSVLVERDPPTDEHAEMPGARDAGTTAVWIRQALRGEVAVPGPIATQVAQCVAASRALAGSVSRA